MLLLSLLLLISGANGLFRVEKYYSQDLTCANYFTSWFVAEVATCTAAPTCENLNNNVGRTVTCSATVPTFPPGWVTFSSYQTIDCTGNVNIMSAPLAVCTGVWIGSPLKLNCVGSDCLLVNCDSGIFSCSGCPSQQTSGINTCIRGNPTSAYTMLSFSITPPAFTTMATTTTTIAGSTTAPIVINGTTAAPTTKPACSSSVNISWVLVTILILTVAHLQS